MESRAKEIFLGKSSLLSSFGALQWHKRAVGKKGAVRPQRNPKCKDEEEKNGT